MPNPLTVFVTDYHFPDLSIEQEVVERAGAKLEAGQCVTAEELLNQATDATVLINQYAQISAEVITALPKCRGIVRYGIGVDTVDIPAATKVGIMVCNVPNYGLHEVSDHTIGLLFGCIRKIPYMSSETKSGVWDCNKARPIRRISDSTLGLAGFGNISRMVAAKMAPWNLRVLVYDPFVDEKVLEEHGAARVSFDELLAESDYISSHLPLTAETKNIFNYDTFMKMKRGGVFVNTSRGGVVDEHGLCRALDEGHLAAAGLDVMVKEPPDPENPLLRRENVILTPHSAWYSEDAAQDLQRMAAEEAVRIMKGEPPHSCVNPEVLEN